MAATSRFPDISRCESNNREKHTVVAGMEGSLVISRSLFPYLALVAFDVGGVLRLLLMVLASPLAGLLAYFISESAGIRVLIFAALAGVRVSDIESAARAVLPKFYSEDIHPEAWRVFSACGTRCVLTATPRIMVEPFLRDYLGADLVVGTEISVFRGRATGLVSSPGVVVGLNRARALQKAFATTTATHEPDIGIGDGELDFPFMQLCKESYVVKRNKGAVRPEKLLKRVVFHDGRLVQKPSPLAAVGIILWIPIGLVLAILRIAVVEFLPMPVYYYASWALGIRVTVKGSPPPPAQGRKGMLFVCSHRNVLDPLFLCIALGRPIPAVTYSISRLGETISPLKTVRLSRDRVKDAHTIKKLLQEGDLVICPEGTTCREPFLLRFSALFAELTDDIVPVAVACRLSMFHGTTARGWKGLDFLYSAMNPSPAYEITFLNKVPYELTCGGGKSSHEVANYIQRAIAATLAYECTNFTRKDKYRELAGNDGTVVG